LSVDAARYVAENFGMPSYALSHFALIPTHAYRSAPLSSQDAPYPVVLYSPSGLMTACVALAEEITSRGYVFITVGHPHWNPYYFDADGNALRGAIDDEFFEALRDELSLESVESVKDDIIRARTTEERLRAHERLNRVLPRNVYDVQVWSDDITFVLDQLTELNERHPNLAGKLDLSRVGVVGFSKGGCAAGQVCLSEPRVACGVNLDGFMYGDIVTTNMTRPFLFAHSEPVVPQGYIMQLFYDRSEAIAYRMKIWGSRHGNFGDPSLYGGVFARSNMQGSIDGERCVEIQNQYVAAFFDKHLKGRREPLLESQSPIFPEVEFSVREPQRTESPAPDAPDTAEPTQ
jgi:dienelactone hydrolase